MLEKKKKNDWRHKQKEKKKKNIHKKSKMKENKTKNMITTKQSSTLSTNVSVEHVFLRSMQESNAIHLLLATLVKHSRCHASSATCHNDGDDDTRRRFLTFNPKPHISASTSHFSRRPTSMKINSALGISSARERCDVFFVLFPIAAFCIFGRHAVCIGVGALRGAGAIMGRWPYLCHVIIIILTYLKWGTSIELL